MQSTQALNHNLATIGNGALLVWWGTVILVDPLTLGMGAIGTGLIMLCVNAARRLNDIPPKPSTTFLGSVAVAWGILDTVFSPRPGFSFAMLLVILGLAMIATLLTHRTTE